MCGRGLVSFFLELWLVLLTVKAVAVSSKPFLTSSVHTKLNTWQFIYFCPPQVELTSRRFIEKRGVGYTLRCPAGCEGSEVTESHHFRLLGKELVCISNNNYLIIKLIDIIIDHVSHKSCNLIG